MRDNVLLERQGVAGTNDADLDVAVGQDNGGSLVDEHDHVLALSEGRLRPAFELRIERLPLHAPRLPRIGLHQKVARGGVGSKHEF